MEAMRPQTVPASAPPATPAERRRSKREAHVVVATLQPPSGDASIDREVTVHNLSLGGVGFRSPERVDVGAVYRITLGTGPLLLNARVKIVSCRRRREGGGYEAGAAFC
jgi:hypothetical protein